MHAKDEGANLNAMTSTQKFVVNCELLVLKKVSKLPILSMQFPRDATMGQHKKKLVKNSNMFQLSVFSFIYKSV